MAPTKNNVPSTEGKQTTQPTIQNQGTYTAAELAANARVIGSTPDIVTAALRMAKVTECTIDEARRIVEKFSKKEVKG